MKKILLVSAAVLLLAAGCSSQTAVNTGTDTYANSAPTDTPTPTPTPSGSSASVNDNATLNASLKNVDSQMNGLNSDSANVDSSMSEQTAP